MAKKICGIYKITNTLNGKVYVGQSINVQERFYEHKRKLRLNQHFNKYLQNAYNKHGEYFEYELIEECTVADLDKREQYWIGFYRSDDKKHGYNIMSGGQLNRPYAEQSKVLISRPVLCIETGVVYPSVAEAQRETGVMNISMACNGKLRHSKGFHWCFADEADKTHVVKVLTRPIKLPCKKVVCIETGEVFGSMKEAAAKYGISASAVKLSCNRYITGQAYFQKSKKHWKYYEGGDDTWRKNVTSA